MAVLLEEGQSGVEEGDGAARGLVGEELGKSEAGVIVDGDMKELPAGALGLAVARMAGDAMAWADDAGELLDVEVDEFTGLCALVAADRQRRFQRGQASGVAS
jgi:hypothetical protein